MENVAQLAAKIEEAYTNANELPEEEKALAKRVIAEYGPVIRVVGNLARHNADVLLGGWPGKSVEAYFELAVLAVLAVNDEGEQLARLLDLTSQLDGILASSERDKARQGAHALLESLILAIEDVHRETSHQILELLARLANAPEGVIAPTGADDRREAIGETDSRLEGPDRALLRGLLEVGLYREVSIFLQQRTDLGVARNRGKGANAIQTPIVSLVSRKGGVGKSMLAFATAAWFLKCVKPRARVCILDLDLSGPVWQYLLFPERNRPSHFLNKLLSLDQGNQKGDFEFPNVSSHEISRLLEKSNIEVEGTTLYLLTLADLPRTSRYLSLAIANNSDSCFGFLVDLVAALEPLVDLVVIDNAPGFGSLALLSHVLTTSVPNGCSIVVSTPALPDLRGSLIELSDLYVLDRESDLVKRPPIWIVNKADSKALAFLNSKQKIADVASAIEAYSDILPQRPLIVRAASPAATRFCGLGLPLDIELLAFSNIQNSGAPPLEDALKTFGSSVFFRAFEEKVGPEMLPLLTDTKRAARPQSMADEEAR